MSPLLPADTRRDSSSPCSAPPVFPPTAGGVGGVHVCRTSGSHPQGGGHPQPLSSTPFVGSGRRLLEIGSRYQVHCGWLRPPRGHGVATHPNPIACCGRRSAWRPGASQQWRRLARARAHPLGSRRLPSVAGCLALLPLMAAFVFRWGAACGVRRPGGGSRRGWSLVPCHSVACQRGLRTEDRFLRGEGGRRDGQHGCRRCGATDREGLEPLKAGWWVLCPMTLVRHSLPCQ